MDKTPPLTDPQAVVLRPAKGKLALYLFCSFALVAIGVIKSPPGGSAMGWLAVAFFGLCGVVFAAQLLPGASYLRICGEGFVICTLFRKSAVIRWRDVGGFRVATVPPSLIKMVVFDWNGASHPGVRRINHALVGADAGLPDTYGMRPQDLASFLNEWRYRTVGTT